MNFCSERFERLSLIGLFTEIQSGLEQESGLWCVIGRWQYCVCRRLRQLADSSSSAFANVLWLSAWLRALTERPSPHHKHRPYACSSGGMNNNRVKLLCTNAAGGRFNDFEAAAPANWYKTCKYSQSTFSLWKTRLPPVGNENAMGDGRGNGRDIIVETTMLHRHS